MLLHLPPTPGHGGAPAKNGPALAGHGAEAVRDAPATDYVYVWADGIHRRIRLAEANSCMLVVLGVRADGVKELIAMADGYRESAESCADLLRDCARRGMRAPVPAVGDGALGFCKALAEVFCEPRPSAVLGSQNGQRARRGPDVGSVQCVKGAAGHLQRRGPRARGQGRRRVREDLRREVAQAARKITYDVDELLAFYDFPAEHWVHLRTTNPLESAFATVRLRTKVTKGAGSAAAALAMVVKLLKSAQARWRAVNAPHLVALVRAQARFERGYLVERPEAHAA